MLTGDPLLVGGRDGDVERRVRVLEQLWLNALWGGGRARRAGTAGIVTAMAQTGVFRGEAVS